ncbi:MAG TPA: NUDIX domain-containing protein [Acidimicrobiales bacterium]|nr:NUDIX domain-containing protein [Acidimicrobiales bacterium]
MMTSDLVDELEALEPVDAREANSIAATLERLTWAVDPFDEFADVHHVTASAFVVSARGVILHRHRRLGIWVQPGGHVDARESPPAAALRECREEVGLDVSLLDERVFHVDVHPGPRGHTHYDLRFVLEAPPLEPRPGPGESPDVFWFDFAAARERAEPTLVAALGKLEDYVARVRDWSGD